VTLARTSYPVAALLGGCRTPSGAVAPVARGVLVESGVWRRERCAPAARWRVARVGRCPCVVAAVAPRLRPPHSVRAVAPLAPAVRGVRGHRR